MVVLVAVCSSGVPGSWMILGVLVVAGNSRIRQAAFFFGFNNTSTMFPPGFTHFKKTNRDLVHNQGTFYNILIRPPTSWRYVDI